MKEVTIGAMKAGEEPLVCHLVEEVFFECVAPDFEEEGCKFFMEYARPDGMAERAENHFVLIAEREGHQGMVGMIEVRNFNHISLFFVRKDCQKSGVGKELFRSAMRRCRSENKDFTGMTVHSSPGAVSAYQTLGFEQRAPENVINGMRFISMKFEFDEG